MRKFPLYPMVFLQFSRFRIPFCQLVGLPRLVLEAVVGSKNSIYPEYLKGRVRYLQA